MTDSPVVGSASFELRATKDKFKADLAGAERDLKIATGKMEDDANKAGERVGGSLGRLSKGIAAGIAALTAVFAAGLAMALQFQQASLKMADTLANSAQRIGISASALQEWQYVARKTGEDATAVGGALERFADKAAGAASGLSKGDVKLFRSIGLEPEDLKRFKDTEALLDEVIDRVTALKSETSRAAAANSFGLDPLATALRTGGDEVARLRDEAQALGFVMDESLIRKGAEAQGKMEDLAQVIGIQMAGAFIDLSDEVLTFTGHIANAISGLNSFIERFSNFKANTNAMYGDNFVEDVVGGNSWQALKSGFGSVFSGRTARAAGDIRAGNSLLIMGLQSISRRLPRSASLLARPERPATVFLTF
ncbi:hypothetical protein PFY01_09040 [Brevundimonas vesicularis]|uniref:hypothetical protein n=1 Tax=Brevundimonas vesicularis TaxID=41276 RepID=UPI0022EC270E|nr:hypothetical protein [Brevundimonas vesicularis]WBT04887.1 hypothetical protein PFY01_09040 [Brevundimonas vesicularis]